ncbi:heme ABC exporter ATP-binding protein CcmA [Mesorhizobium sp. BE184]|uniref:heme ABC exporter ATP-binding protein CcmA n=1 Tax=Mesorhizobium sp. BE184 TaxID=2817714 RepID=UPI002860D85A|nr:heme ABC exporter ATP-binding protein CcmA [Mesorhizobium sp. BE184]MDR7033943.1 heme exporter protein A [Mesorhizobium sp. BE184]
MRLVAEDLSGERGGEPVFSEIGFALESGQALAVTGPNGSGKSTLLRVLCGLLPASNGNVRLEGGGDAFPTPAAACHYLGHHNAMKPALTVRENLDFWQRFARESDGVLSGQAAALSVMEALAAVGLDAIPHLPFGYLSTGQRRRVAIARLLVSFRPIWLLDEPTAGLDKASEVRFAGLMKAHCSAGGIVVAATHSPLGLEEAGQLRMGASSPSPQEAG